MGTIRNGIIVTLNDVVLSAQLGNYCAVRLSTMIARIVITKITRSKYLQQLSVSDHHLNNGFKIKSYAGSWAPPLRTGSGRALG